MKKKLLSLVMAGVMVMSMSVSAFAGSWEQTNSGWRYQNSDGTYKQNTWAWLDENMDGIAECYCFDYKGYMYSDTVTPDGYYVNSEGAWTEHGKVMTKASYIPLDNKLDMKEFMNKVYENN